MQYSNTPWQPEIAADDEKKYINMQYWNTPWRPKIFAGDEKKYINMQYWNTPWRPEIFAGDEKKYMNMQQVALFPDQVSELWSPLRMLCCIIF